MHCPYCVSEIPDEALVCSVCRRDLFVIKPLLEKIAQLEAELATRPPAAAVDQGALPDTDAVVQSATPEMAQSSPAADWRLALAAWLLPLAGLLLAHWLIVFVYDTKLIFLRVLALLLPLPFGFLFCRQVGARMGWASAAALVMAVAAVFGMSAVTGWLDQVPVMPQNMAEVREFIEFAVSIAFSFITGAWAAHWLQRRAALKAEQQAQAKLARGATVNGQKVADSLSRLNDVGSAVVGVATTAISIYTGLKDFLGN